MGKRLSGWKGRFLSKRGKLVLLQSVLSSLPIYFLSLYAALVSVMSRIERIHGNFLWCKARGEEDRLVKLVKDLQAF